MRLNAPTKLVWFISLILGLAGIIFHFMDILPAYNLWMVFVAWVLLILATMLKGF
jgi:predicted membrane protein